MFFLKLFNSFIRIFENIVEEIFDRCSFSEGINDSKGIWTKIKPPFQRGWLGVAVLIVYACLKLLSSTDAFKDLIIR
jgi:hypothetical protein